MLKDVLTATDGQAAGDLGIAINAQAKAVEDSHSFMLEAKRAYETEVEKLRTLRAQAIALVTAADRLLSLRN